jgi:hypothetical protein
MTEKITRRRVIWQGRICTVIAETGRKLELRDDYGFRHTNVPKRQTSELSPEDERASFTFDA